MAVWLRQIGDDQGPSEYQIAPIAGESDLELLALKATSHDGKGWVVVWSGLNTFTATKHYPGNLIRQRIFEIR